MKIFIFQLEQKQQQQKSAQRGSGKWFMAFQQYAHFPTIFIAIFRAHCKKFFMHACMYVVHNDAMTNDMLCEADFLIFLFYF